MKNFLTNRLFILIGLSLTVLACNKNENVKPDTSGRFVKFYGGAYDDFGYSVAASEDGGFYVAGSTFLGSRADTNIFVVKADANGNPIWTKYYNLGDNYDEVARDMLIDKSGNIIIAGYKRGKQNTTDVLLLKINASNPETISFSVFGDTAVDEKGYNVVQSPDGAFIVYGSTETKAAALDAYLLKTSFSDTIWKRQIGVLSKNDFIGNLEQTDDNRLVWCGTTVKNNGSNMTLTKSDNYGNLIWSFAYEPNDDINQYGRNMAKTQDGYVIAGSKNRTADANSPKDIYIVKTNTNGISNADDKIVVTGQFSMEANSIIPLENGVYAITGYTRTANGDKNIYVAKVTEEGKVLASAEFGADGDDEGKHIIHTSDNGFLVIGSIYAVNNSMMAAYKMDYDLKLVK